MSKIQFRTLFRTHSYRIVLLMGPLVLVSCNQSPENRPSPLKVVESKIKDTEIVLTYSSPSVRNRKIFGNGSEYLEPYEELWRTGANKATTIYMSNRLLIDSLEIDSGTYSIFTIPGEETWTVIFNKEWDQWGSYDYKDSDDVFRIQVPSSKLSELQEKMNLFIERDSLKFAWEYTSWSLPIAILP